MLFIFNSLYTAIACLFSFSFVAIIHELGHLIFCKIFKIGATEFSIGVGPVLWKKKYNGTTYMISLFPIAAFVKPGKENEEEESDSTYLQNIHFGKEY